MAIRRNSSTPNAVDDNPESQGVPAQSPDEIIQHYKRLAEEVGPQIASLSISDEVLNKLVAGVMRHMLFKNQSHPGVPVRREELVAVVHGQGYGDRRNLTSYVILHAQSKFSYVFGLEMKEIKKLKRGKTDVFPSQGAVSDSKEYVLRNIYPSEFLQTFVEKESLVHIGFAAVVAFLIKSNGGKLDEDKLFDSLSRLDLHMHEHHPVLGKMDEALKGLESQRFIHKRTEMIDAEEKNIYSLSILSLEHAAQLTYLMKKFTEQDEEL